MKPPLVSQHGSGFLVEWRDVHLQARAGRLHEKSDDTYAEVTLEDTTEVRPKFLHSERLNITSGRAKTALAETMKKRWNTLDWGAAVEQMARGVLEKFRMGEEVHEVTGDDAEPITWQIRPYLAEGDATVLFGMGGSAKSYMAMLMAIAVQLPWHNNPLGWQVCERSQNPLWLDWETSRSRFNWRLARLRAGMKLPYVSINYRRCHARLASEIDAIRDIVEERKCKLIVVDSLFGAVGADLNATQPASEFFAATRMIPATWLLITHLSKGSDIQGREATPFGTIYYFNEARAVWEVKKVQEIGRARTDVAIFHRKANDSELFLPVSYRVSFDGDVTTISRQDIRDVPDLDVERPTPVRVREALKKGGRTVKEIAAEVHATEANIRAVLSRLHKGGEVVQLGKSVWGLAADRLPETTDEAPDDASD